MIVRVIVTITRMVNSHRARKLSVSALLHNSLQPPPHSRCPSCSCVTNEDTAQFRGRNRSDAAETELIMTLTSPLLPLKHVIQCM